MFTSYDWLDNPAVLRIRINDRKVEQVWDLTNLTDTGHVGPWLGLAPDDSPAFTQRYRDSGRLCARLGRALMCGDL